MSIPSELDQASKDLVSRFFEEYGIRAINITQGEDIRKDEVCLVEMIFAADSDSDGKDYVVSFKLTGDAIDLHHHISSIDCPANPVLVLTTEGEKLTAENVRERLRHSLSAMEG
ncbi:MAG: hypothetical protein KZQ72_07085 [Candidatus Thiodiazotropha sp. (ex Cardiolucina cf. quadrata)]|nr:hypothetical protein [Candidatus Thiodiazotropha sp. (ex Cardiolucina cf. quadrata)]